MGKNINAILQPGKNGLIHGSKPYVFVVCSPHDDTLGDTGISSKFAYAFARDLGYGVINAPSRLLTFDQTTAPAFSGAIKASHIPSNEITIWFNGHGLVGSLFGPDGNYEDELNWTIVFSDFVHSIEKHCGKKVKNVVLGACYSASEIISKDGKHFVNSPARLLSILLPDVSVVGFFGQYANASVSELYTECKGVYAPIYVKPEKAAVLFRKGWMVETGMDQDMLYSSPVYHSKRALSRSICKQYHPDVEQPKNLKFFQSAESRDYDQLTLAREEMAKLHGRTIPLEIPGASQLDGAEIAFRRYQSLTEKAVVASFSSIY